MTYYVKKPSEDEPKGPFEVKEIVHHIENAWLPENALIAAPGSHEWIPIKQVPEFATAFAFLKKVGLDAPFARPTQEARPFIPSGQLSCPKCSNAARGGRGCLVIAGIILLFPIGLLFLLIKPTYKCRKCGFTFQP